MKKLWGMEIESSDWNQKLKITAYIVGILAVTSAAITLAAKVTIPGLTPLAMGCTMLLLGIREFNVYFKTSKSKFNFILGTILILLFAVDLYDGIMQILLAIGR